MDGFIKRRFASALPLCVLASIAAGCSAESKLASNSDLSGGLWGVVIRSPAFRDMDPIPQKYTQEGENLSPPLQWSKGPNLVREWILIVQDPDAKNQEGYPLTHWSVFKIPANVHALPEGASTSIPYPQGRNYQGKDAYAGPKPPPGKAHRYFFQIFAVDEEQEIRPGEDRATVIRNFRGHVLSKGQLIGTYKAGGATDEKPHTGGQSGM
jgi:Raf kinase inhibitor-like YbhB/YbcL family protein